MVQIILVFGAMAAGLLVGRLTGGFGFSPAVCIVAGVFLVTPSLFALEPGALRAIPTKGAAIGRNLLINHVLLTVAALGIGVATGDLGIAAALVLLALLPGGGMVMAWVRGTGADVTTGFALLVVNLALVLPVTFIFDALPGLIGGWFAPGQVVRFDGGLGVPPMGPFMVLVVVPFLLSRWLKDSAPGVVGFVERHREAIGRVTIAGIVFYLFALSAAQTVFEVGAAALGKAAVGTLVFYGVALGLARVIAPKTPEGRAVFWHAVTRYVTLALIFASFGVIRFGPSFLLPIIMAYVVQFALAPVLAGRMRAGQNEAGQMRAG